MPELLLRPDRIAAGGDAIGRDEQGRIVFIDGAIPGESVRARVHADKRDYARATMVEVVEASADRRRPPCSHVARGCGGCGWQHITVRRQRELKRELVLDAFRRIARLPDLPVTMGAWLPEAAFRTTIRATVDERGHLGYRRAHSHEVIAVDDCMVAHPALEELLATIRLPGAGDVVLRVADDGAERLVWWTGSADAVGIPPDVRTGPSAFVTEQIEGVELRVSARSFFQSSPEAAVALVRSVAELAEPWLTSGATPVIDAYAGVGLFATAVATRSDASIVAIEQAPSSCADARHNLRGAAAQVVEASVDDWEPVSAGLVIADPARRGLGQEAAARLAATGAGAFVLISCDAAAGARDLRLLTGHGFVARHSILLDPFPQTPHVEFVTLLTRDSSDVC